ncbi:MAG: hypothetical protein KatS3mg049_1646 [Caldilinea sp.]|jgi:hypothetical protein|uniref:Uncharacterized protein n=1 Tax=Caldilinea aerophila (strain DSM 14535 / JCM 11387 / NBRC 104270 / STL-6-O1) TaxID=926550 RepID=I0I917_CALAS|nr:hypothetical protein CLDAP_37150 [Caldilinea aerophila DSM 14535 = NBRC 104270]GIV73090.1 MAG: hypothetical protein KatS3mg049_1646 [Caldilinea sp.]
MQRIIESTVKITVHVTGDAYWERGEKFFALTVRVAAPEGFSPSKGSSGFHPSRTRCERFGGYSSPSTHVRTVNLSAV